jgi:GDPmannose 4,6-dehydratase
MYWESKRVLITGLSGFVGSYLGEYLLEQGAEIYGLVRGRADGDVPRNIRDHNLDTRVQILTGDLMDQTSLSDALAKSRPDVIFHLAAQSFVPRSFQYPGETYTINVGGTWNLLESIRLRGLSPRFIFSGSSEEYGLVFASEQAQRTFTFNRGSMFPVAKSIPELPINELNPLRPVSPYGISKLQGDYMVRNYSLSWDLPTVVSRAFNHEGAGRGSVFVTSIIASQVANIDMAATNPRIIIGNMNAFRDWSHVKDIVKGYSILAEKGASGEVYNQGSERTSSILSYILLALAETGLKIEAIQTFKNNKNVIDPLQLDHTPIWGCNFEKTKIDAMMLNGDITFDLDDGGVWVDTDRGRVAIEIDPAKFRPIEVPILLADTAKIRDIGFSIDHSLPDIVRDQVRYFARI